MQSDPFQILLPTKNGSGRGVRLLAVGPSGREKASIETARLVGKDGTGSEYGIRLQTELLKASLIAVTSQRDIKSQEDLLKVPETGWITLSAEKLETDPKYTIDALFTARDMLLLKGICGRLYDVTESDVDDIMGKALPLSAG